MAEQMGSSMSRFPQGLCTAVGRSVVLLLLICLATLLIGRPEAQAIPSLQLDSVHSVYYHMDRNIEYLEDVSGDLDVEAIRQLSDKAWTKSSVEHPSFGFSDSAYWFRAELETSELQNWLLEVDSPLLDEIELYLFYSGQLLQKVKTGDSRPFAERPLGTREFVFPLHLPASGPVSFYMRVKSSGAVQVPMNLWVDSAFIQEDEVETAALGAYFGAILVMMIYNFFLYARVREISYIYYVLYIALFALFIIALSGWGYKYLWPASVGLQQYALVLFIIFGDIAVCLFIYHFLNLPKYAPRIGNILIGTVLALLLLCILLPVFGYNPIVQFALVITIGIALVALYSGISLWQGGGVEARYFAVAWSAFLITVILAILEKFALLPLIYSADVLLPSGMMLELTLLSLALGARIYDEKQRRIQMQEKLIQVQTKSQMELERQVQERTVELKEANAELERLAIIDDLTGVFNRRHFLERGAESVKAAQRYRRPLSVVMLDIDHFKLINDAHGHAAGDEVLGQLAQICQRMKRDTDIFGRLGGEEFGLILPETPALSAFTMAERLRGQVEALPTDYEGTAINITISQGVYAVDPELGYPSIDQMLKFADDALYQAKESGRNRVEISSGAQ